jgi:Predicted membrane protein (DUF2157)
MHTLQPELQALRAAPGIDSALLERRLALADGTRCSLHGELRAAFYLAVLLIVAGAGLLVARNLQHIGPLLLTGALLAAAAVCYAVAWRARRARRERSLGEDYLLLLGALLFSTAAGYAEAQFRWSGSYWSLQLLLIALLHALSAYYFDSRLLLSVALTGVATWFGVESGPRTLAAWEWPATETAWRALACAVAVFFWRVQHGHQDRWRNFDAVLEHFTANLALIGAVALCTGNAAWLGLLLALALGAVCVHWGRARRDALFVIYGVLYTAVALCIVLVRKSGDWQLSAIVVLLITCGAAVLLWRLLARLNARSAP